MNGERNSPTPAAVPGDAIGAGLRRLWQSFEDEPVPDDFFDLLDRIDVRRASLAAEQATAPDEPGEQPHSSPRR